MDLVRWGSTCSGCRKRLTGPEVPRERLGHAEKAHGRAFEEILDDNEDR